MMVKRGFDLVLSILILVFLWPLILIIAAVVCRKLGTPIFFVQQRPGLNTKPFNMIKFRTMLDTKDENGKTLPDSDRLTSFGKFLRSTSLDELPTILNVLTGDMSIVGPRPLLMQYLPRYTTAQARRHDIRPGVTGWAQVNGRNSLSWDEKFALDVWYVDNQSFWLDKKILLMSVAAVFARRGIAAPGDATMPEFKGCITGEPDNNNDKHLI